jgi:PleD family two-component response regulator
VATRLKKVEETKDIPVLVLSGGESINISMVLALGAEDFITKPFSDAIFLSTIERLAKRREVNHAYDTVGGR